MRRALLAACVATLSMGACTKSTTRPIADGYTLQGLVTARTGVSLPDVAVFLGSEGSSEFHPFAVTGDDGAFLFKPAPNTAPSTELFRFEKPGFVAREVLARTATRLEPYRYRLEVALDPEPIP